MKEKGLYRDTVGVHKGKSPEALSHEPPPQTENKNKTHKAQQQVPKTKTKKLRCSILKPESASRKFTEATVQATSFSTFFCLSALGPGTLQMEPTRYYCLKKSDSLPQAAPPS